MPADHEEIEGAEEEGVEIWEKIIPLRVADAISAIADGLRAVKGIELYFKGEL